MNQGNQGNHGNRSNANSNNSNSNNENRGRDERPTKRRRINTLLGKTPVTLGNANLLQHYEDAAPYVHFSGSCRPYGDAFVFARVPNEAALNITQFPTDYSTSVAECLGKPGYHVWIVFEGGTFAAARVFSVYEILSKHMDLYLQAGRLPVIAAGEVAVVGDDAAEAGAGAGAGDVGVMYNFLSGTFMQDIAERYGRKYTHKPYEEFYGEWMDALWREAGASVVKRTDKTVIGTATIPLTEEVLRSFTRGGVEFRSFPTLEECRRYSDYHSVMGEAKRGTLRTMYNNYRRAMERYGAVPSFEEWLEGRGQSNLFREVPVKEPMFRNAAAAQGGRRTRRKRSKRSK